MLLMAENTETETLGRKIIRLRLVKGLSQTKLGKLAGVDHATLSKVESEERNTISWRTAERLAPWLDISPELLMTKKATPEPKIKSPGILLEDVSSSLRAYMPVYNTVSAGEGIEPIDYIAITRSKPVPDTFRAYRVEGLCLEPEIKNGDTVIVDLERSPVAGNLVVVIFNGKASIKRFRENEKGEKWLENNQGSYKPEDVHQVGVVVGFYRDRV
jgi:SOS-response transcriptional repressor LexA